MAVETVVRDAEVTSSSRLLVLHAIRLKGTAGLQVICDLTGLAAPSVEKELTRAYQEGLVQERTGRLSGFRLTDAGKEQHTALLVQDANHPRRAAGLEQAYEAFLPLNGDLKDICGRWQVLPDGRINEHTDPDYDAQVIADLADVERAASAALRRAGQDCARLAVYAERFHEALARVQAGEREAFARPMARSFHDAWMELHQDLLLSLGRDRDAADGH
ncbi:MAG: MarR family transcriptional regulator [Mycobacteriales bacterium]